MFLFNNKFSNKSQGQAMAEFALTIPVFFLLVFGIIELSRFFLVYSSVFTAVREATRYGSSVGDEGILNYLDCSEIAETAVRTGHFGGVQKGLVSINYESVVPEGDELRALVASCPNNDFDTVPIKISDGEKYIPSLGDRIYIEIATDYVSLLGVVPNLTVDASNGRTIMMGVQSQMNLTNTEDPYEEVTSTPTQTSTSTTTPTFTSTSTATTIGQNPTTTMTPTITPSATPITPVVCPGLVMITKQGGANRINYVEFEIENETNIQYKLVEIKVTGWQKTHGGTERKLQQIIFGGVSVWPSNQMYEGPPVTVNTSPGNFLIDAYQEKILKVLFTNNTTQNINLKFTLTFNEVGRNCSLVLTKN